MELWHFEFLFLIAASCQISGEISGTEVRKTADQPLAFNLGHELVARRNDSSTSSSLFMEGGSVNSTVNKSTTPASISSSEQKIVKLNTSYPVLPVDSAMAMSWPETGHDKNSSIKARKGVSVTNDETSPTTAVLCTCCVSNITDEELKNCTCCNLDSKTKLMSFDPEIKAVTVNTTQTDVNLTAQISSTTSKSAATSSESPPLVPAHVVHHQKPNVTADAPDQQVPAQQEDYVIPVVGIIFAIPLIIILGALVYKKGADLWERRHYRRMDFLIDGIYNQ